MKSNRLLLPVTLHRNTQVLPYLIHSPRYPFFSIRILTEMSPNFSIEFVLNQIR